MLHPLKPKPSTIQYKALGDAVHGGGLALQRGMHLRRETLERKETGGLRLYRDVISKHGGGDDSAMIKRSLSRRSSR